MLNLLLTLALAAAPQGVKPATNTSCPVLGEKVTAKSPVVTVNGQQYRICCAGCDKKLLATPAKYLNPDGTLKLAAKK